MELTLLIILAMVLCLAASFLFSGMEAGVLALNRVRIRQQMKAGRRQARVLYGFLENPERFLWTILVGNTLANFTVVSVGLIALHRALNGRLALVIPAFAVFIFLFHVVCDLLPKMLFRLYPNRLCLALALPYRLIHAVLSPVVAIVESLAVLMLRWTGARELSGHVFESRSELRLAMQESTHALSTDERAMIKRVLDLPDVTLRTITVPMEKVVTVSVTATAGDIVTLFRQHPLSRIPVWEMDGQRRRIAGVIALEDVIYIPNLDPSRPAREFVRPALYLHENVPLEEALRRMQRGSQRLAVVLGRDQKEIGIAQLNDLLKAIFGDLSL